MTYGEYHYLIKYDMKLQNGKWVASKPNVTIPKRMSREAASRYYSAQLSSYWKSIKKTGF